MSPKIIAFEPWKYTTNTQYTNSDNHSDQEADRTSEVNVQLAKMTVDGKLHAEVTVSNQKASPVVLTAGKLGG